MSRTGVRTACVAIAIALVGAVGHLPRASAAAGSGELDHGSLAVGVEVGEPGSGPVPIDAGSRSLPRLVHYVATPLPGGALGTLENVCNASGGALTDPNDIAFGWIYDVIAYGPGNTVISDTHQCVPFPDPTATSRPPGPPVLPVPPTVGEVWRAVALPRPVIGVNPVSRGVTGLATRLWSGGGTTARVAVTIAGFTVTGIARVVEYRYATDEGSLGSGGPGSESAPAATHVFSTKGAHTLSVSSVWRATVTMTGPGIVVPVAVDIDSAVLTVIADYPVVEVRARLVG